MQKECFKNYLELDGAQRLIFLSSLAYYVTLIGRETYIPQTDGVENPEKLRKLNELQHNIINHIRAHAFNSKYESQDKSFMDSFLDQIKEIETEEKAQKIIQDSFNWAKTTN